MSIQLVMYQHSNINTCMQRKRWVLQGEFLLEKIKPIHTKQKSSSSLILDWRGKVEEKVQNGLKSLCVSCMR